MNQVERQEYVQKILGMVEAAPDRYSALATLLENGVTPVYIGHGVSRETYAVSEDMVIKLENIPSAAIRAKDPGDEWGEWSQTVEEVKSMTLRPDLFPKLYGYVYGDGVAAVVVEKAKVLKWPELQELMKGTKASRYTELSNLVMDFGCANLGLVGDDLVVIDGGYGLTNEAIYAQ